MLQEFDRLPEGLLDCDSRRLAEQLGMPTLIHLSGAREPALFVSVLMHGNETVGWDAMRELLRDRLTRFGELRLPRSLSLFIGNVTAAACGVRHLPGQPDYNRVWPGSDLEPCIEQELMARVTEIMRQRGIFASLDLHNNTGINPHYACVNRVENPFLRLAMLFGRTLVYFTHPTGVQSMAMAALCPAVTVECGKVGDRRGIEHARRFVDAALHLTELPDHPVKPQDIDLFHTVARVKVPETVRFGFAPADADLLLDPELERFNFRELPCGTPFARLRNGEVRGFEVRDTEGADVGERYFRIEDGEIRLRRPMMPSMLTLDETVIRQDCLCYLMERYAGGLPELSR
ncbi:M14 family metallopeptidase [Thiorhodococcus fuscus]|uniref:M14 family metallopeptidase n=1 Tax=Thiorhodococcus fuscus TaxID=527200 RepID=A0ABW4YD40_9GAMM